MNNSNEIIVSICCVTYNHAPYIRQCLDGFLMQKTDFKYEIIIHDDCSTDGTTDIVKEYADKYPELIVPIIQHTNQYQNGIKSILATFVYPKVRGKYIALCEGDDYWIDSLKLERQVSFLEESLTYVAVSENGYEINTVTGEMQLFNKSKEHDLMIEEMIVKRRFPTASVLFRSNVLDSIFYSMKISMDTELWIYLASKGNFRYLMNVSSVYRRGSGITVREDPYRFAKLCEDMYNKLIDRYASSFDVKAANNAIFEGYLYSLPKYIHQKKITYSAFKCLFKCIKLDATRTLSYFFSKLFALK